MNTLEWFLQVAADGTLRLRNVSVIVDTSDAPLPLDTELLIEVVADGAGNAFVLVFEGDDLIEVLSGAGFGTDVRRIRFGEPGTSVIWPQYFWAHLAVSRTAVRIGPVPEPYVDPGLVPANTLHVELYLGEAWTDISSYVRYKDRVKITRGYKSESSKLDPSKCTMTLDNIDGRFSPRNPLSPLYGMIGRNTPLRVRVRQNGIDRYRFYGEVSEWPIEIDKSGDEATVGITASGITRRLEQNEGLSSSATYRAHTHPSQTDIKAYWPLEDGKESTTIASGRAGHPAMKISGTPALADYDDWTASQAIPTMNTGRFWTPVPTYTATGETMVYFFFLFEGAPAAETNLIRLFTTGTARRWDLSMLTTGDVRLKAWDSDGSAISDGGGLLDDLLGVGWDVIEFLFLALEFTQDGSDIEWSVALRDFGPTDTISGGLTGSSWTGTVTGHTFGVVTQVVVGADGAVGNTKIGHLAVADDIDLFLSDIGDAVRAWNGENPSDRLERLSAEEGIPFQVITRGQTGNFVTLGDQLPQPFIDLVREAADTDLGLFLEPRDVLGLGYRTRLSLYNQDAILALSYSGHDLSEAIQPADDDQTIVNDVTVKRAGGSSVRLEQTAGPLSVATAQDGGVGRYPDSVTISLETDVQLADQAGWRLHLGTADEPRLDEVALHLGRAEFADDVAMMTAALAVDIGDRITISGPPSQLPPDDLSVQVIGYTEEIDQFEHVITFVTRPESPWRVGYRDDEDTARRDSADSALAATVDADDTSWSVAVGSVLWTTDGSDTPFDLMVGGERVTVTTVGTVLNSNPFLASNATGWTGFQATVAHSTTVVHP
ncbi:MAG: hypothetical protein ACRDQ0_06410, partial [Pseudonocardia sp.]